MKPTRDKAIEAARGLTVLVMPAVHTVMMYGKPEVHQSWLAYILIFFAEGPGAQLFMFLMGFFNCLGKPKPNRFILKRTVYLLLAGYILNVFRAVIPYSLGLLPPDFLAAYPGHNGLQKGMVLLLTGDILQMAGLSYSIISCIRRSRFAVLLSLILYITIAFSAPFLWNIRLSNPVADHLLALYFAGDERAFFPLFPWLCYPLAGMVAGYFYQRILLSDYYKKAGLGGLVIFAAGGLIYYFMPTGLDLDFYRSSPGRTICQTGFVLLWIWFMRFLVTFFRNNLLFNLLAFCSRHITVIYVAQWIIICWGMAITGYQDLTLSASIMALLLVSIICFGFTYLINRHQQNGDNTHFINS